MSYHVTNLKQFRLHSISSERRGPEEESVEAIGEVVSKIKIEGLE